MSTLRPAFANPRSPRRRPAALRLGPPSVVLWASSWEREPLLVGTGAHRRVLTQGSCPVVLHGPPTDGTASSVLPGHRGHRGDVDPAPIRRVRGLPRWDLRCGLSAPQRSWRGEVCGFERRTSSLLTLPAKLCHRDKRCSVVVDNMIVRGDGAHYSTVGSLGWRDGWCHA